MRLPSSQIVLAVLCVSLAACGSVANRAVSGTGGTPGADDAGAGGGAGGGSIGTDASAAGGAGDAGQRDAGPSDGPRLLARGGISSFGILSQPTGGAIRITRQRFGSAPVCAGNVCVSGGLSPR